MKHRLSALVVLAATFAAAPALADGETVQVHIDAASKVVLQRMDDDGDAAFVCRAPCDLPLEVGPRYRITGDGIRPSSPFRLESDGSDRVVLTPKLASSAAFTSGVVLTAIASVLLTGALFFAGGAVVAGKEQFLGGVLPGLGGIACGVVSLATGIPGTILLTSNFHSSVTQTGAPLAFRAPTWSPPDARLPGFTSVPLLAGTF